MHFVALAPIRDPELVVPTIGRTLAVGMDGARPPLETLTEYLRDRELLLVLDNLEQVLDVGPLAELLAACDRPEAAGDQPHSLRVSGEHELDVPPLSVPDAFGRWTRSPPRGPGAVRGDSVLRGTGAVGRAGLSP